MSEDEKLAALLQRIYDKTVKGELRWEPTANGNAFTVAFARFSLSLERVSETDDLMGYILLRISNDRGQTIEEFTEGQAAQIGFAHMNELFDRARRIAMDLDEALDELLSELDEPPLRKS
jgi:hypothetical protein